MGKKEKTLSGIPAGAVNIGQVINGLMNTDFRLEVTLEALIELLQSKKNPDGTAMFANKEIENKVIEIRDRALAEMQLTKPSSSLIVPGGSGLMS